MNATLEALAEEFTEAWQVVKGLPSPIPKRATTYWPDTVGGKQDYADADTKVRVLPDPSKVDPSVEIVMSWPALVKRDHCRKVLFFKAANWSYRSIADLGLAGRGISHETARRWHKEALQNIKEGLGR
jgi:hypothetical protein